MNTRSLFLMLCTMTAVIFAACAAPSSPAPAPTQPVPTPTASPLVVAEKLAQAYIAANAAKDTVAYMSLFSDDAVYMDNSNATMRKEGVIYFRSNFAYVKYLFSLKDYAMKMTAHFISHDGRFIAVTGDYTNTGKDGNPATVPVVVVLEVKGDKLFSETVYYDPSVFY